MMPMFGKGVACAIVTIIVSACNSAPQFAASRPSSVPMSFNVHDNTAAATHRTSPQLAFISRREDGIKAIHPDSGATVWQNSSCDAHLAKVVANRLYVDCYAKFAIVDARSGHIVRAASLALEAVDDVVPASKSVIVVEGWSDGSTLRNELFILNAKTLDPIVNGSFTDSTFLGVIGDRIYIDDWCCNGRAQTRPVDLRPEPGKHLRNYNR